MLSRSSTILAGVGLNASGLNPALHIQYFNRSYDVNNPHIFKKLDDLDILDTSEDGDFVYDQRQAVSTRSPDATRRCINLHQNTACETNVRTFLIPQ